MSNKNLEELENQEIDEDLTDTDIDDDFDRYDCVLLECKVCGVEYSESMGHECMEPEKEPDEFEDNDPDSYETIYCEPTCPNCGRDENECVGRCDDSEEMEPEPIEEEFEPSADFCWTHKTEDDCKKE